jgi:hypothetical protein
MEAEQGYIRSGIAIAVNDGVLVLPVEDSLAAHFVLKRRQSSIQDVSDVISIVQSR